jgi:hypothetical protein
MLACGGSCRFTAFPFRNWCQRIRFQPKPLRWRPRWTRRNVPERESHSFEGCFVGGTSTHGDGRMRWPTRICARGSKGTGRPSTKAVQRIGIKSTRKLGSFPGDRRRHREPPLGQGNRRRVPSPSRPQIRQPGHNHNWISCRDCGAGGCFTASAHPQSNDAGEVIEREP